MTIRVAIADDHPVVLSGLKALLQAAGDMEVVATCTNGDHVRESVQTHHPDVLLLDIRMPGKDGLTVLREVGAMTRVVLITGELSDDDAAEAIRLGVRGVLLKQMAPQLLLDCVRKVYAGQR